MCADTSAKAESQEKHYESAVAFDNEAKAVAAAAAADVATGAAASNPDPAAPKSQSSPHKLPRYDPGTQLFGENMD